MKLFFVRHAESVSNAKLKDVLGKGDQLSPLGVKQAEDLSAELTKHRYDHIYVSPSRRTIQTLAPYLRATGRQATILPICAEAPGRSLPRIIEGLLGTASKKSESKSMDMPTEYAALLVPHPKFQAPPVRHESLNDGVKRTGVLIKYLIDTHGESKESVLLVSHGVIGRQLISRMTGTLVPHPDNAQLWKLSGAGCPLFLERINGRTVSKF